MKLASLLIAALSLVTLGGALSAQVPPPGQNKPRGRPMNADPVDFTPRPAELRLNGAPTSVTVFYRGQDRVIVATSPPWTPSGSSNEFVLTAIEYPQARITLRRSSLSKPAALDAAWAEETAALILRGFPADSRRVVRERRAQPLTVNDWKTYEISVGFDQAGGRFIRGYVFALTPRGELLELITGAREQDYPTVRANAVALFATWQDLNAQQFAYLRTERDPNQPTVKSPSAPPSRR